jgi:hypothetical protein
LIARYFKQYGLFDVEKLPWHKYEQLREAALGMLGAEWREDYMLQSELVEDMEFHAKKDREFRESGGLDDLMFMPKRIGSLGSPEGWMIL